MKLTKIFCLNEDYLFPDCKKCGQEISPFCVTSEELNKVDKTYAETLIKSNLLIVNGLSTDKHILFLCQTCTDLEKDIL